MTYYCASCRRSTHPYDLWPNGECVCCYMNAEHAVEIDAA